MCPRKGINMEKLGVSVRMTNALKVIALVVSLRLSVDAAFFVFLLIAMVLKS